MKIMGIDPGLAKTGWGVIELQANSKICLIGYGCITTSKNYKMDERLSSIYGEICELISKFKPDEGSIEEIFFASNAKTAINVAHARGVIMIALNHSGIKVFEYTPLEIKKAVVGYGKADKAQVQYMVRSIMGLKEVPKPDHASDAIAAALCHGNAFKLNSIITGK